MASLGNAPWFLDYDLSLAFDKAPPAAITSGGVPPVAHECFLTSKVDWNMVA